MRDGGGEPPICRAVRPDHYEENHTTRNLTRGKRHEGEAKGVDVREGRKRTLEKHRVSDSKEQGE
jgi:hypothetical protein